MNTRVIAILGSVVLALAMAVHPQQNAEAKKCYDQNKEEIPCPKSDYLLKQQAQEEATATASPTPTDTPKPTATDTPKPTATDTPQGQQSAVGAPPANPGLADGAASGSVAPTPPTKPTGFPLAPWLLLGGGVLLVGILIGMLLPAVQKRSTGGLRNVNGLFGRTDSAPGELLPAVDVAHKGWQQADNGGTVDSFYKAQDQVPGSPDIGAGADSFHKVQD